MFFFLLYNHLVFKLDVLHFNCSNMYTNITKRLTTTQYLCESSVSHSWFNATISDKPLLRRSE